MSEHCANSMPRHDRLPDTELRGKVLAALNWHQRESSTNSGSYLTAEVKTSSIAGTAHPATGSWFTRESVQSGCATPPYDATPE
jgi:hypothetical protein